MRCVGVNCNNYASFSFQLHKQMVRGNLIMMHTVKVAVHPRGPRKHCVISAYIFNEKSRVRLGTK